MEYIKEEMINFLKQDKINILEGLCVENEFKKQFKDLGFSEGWWGVTLNYGDHRNKLVIFHLLKNYNLNKIQDMSDLDKEIYMNFLQKGILLFTVKFVKKEFHFSQLIFNNITNDLRENIVLEKDLANFLNLRILNKKLEENTNYFKLNRVIEYFTDENILEEVYVERLFANEFLSNKYGLYPINIDAIVKKPYYDKLTILEIKFKYPDKSNSFGINRGQAKLLCLLNNIGFQVLHMIAENPVKDPDIGYFELPHNQSLAERTFWHYKFLSNEDFNNDTKIAPGKTNITGKGSQEYIPIEKNEFSLLVNKNGESVKVQFPSKFYNMPPCKICNNFSAKFSFNRNTDTYFLGCHNYKEHNKKS